MARDITFLTVFLESCGAVNNDEAGKLLSAWTSTVRIEGPEPTDSNSLYIPLLPPGMLKIKLNFKMNDRLVTEEQELFTKLREIVGSSIRFWEEQLFYQVQDVSTIENHVILSLKCTILTNAQISTFISKPRELHTHAKGYPEIYYLSELSTTVNFFSKEGNYVEISHVIPHFNEYFSSLIVSQLEFEYPMVFSMISRLRLKWQQSSLAPISYALTSNSVLLPIMLNMIAQDKSSTTAYQILCRRRGPPIQNFQIFSIPAVTYNK
ncbi:ANM_HP_G0215270.mRNA.1.CDS.1 [Saccharomyces cerevisiae]|nr:Rec102p [Saccharomyces cerevisiae P283]CAI4601311.1 CEQ_1a_G0037440.mRNA.1.CDS.1 [Saccharomyces cerevisiae]CAI4938223.1 ANM_HP_G0117870.mRNA.1.CDS.1 [Saccharomyces cerevisiae]CAI4969632.1 ANM_HP_G0140040.mRNA.1.CDS.1 [Saccharomyces cerevisiae]CAI4997268.1 ANM_HP_G0159760.mRNA.1.CDS.1 [Saccharomyces cerevisiae]